MKMSRGFKGSNYFPPKGSEESTAIIRLKGMKVYKVMNSDPFYYHTFEDVWYAVWDECDMYRTNVDQGGQEQYNEFIGSGEGLTWATYRRTVEWLREYAHLVNDDPTILLRWM